MMHPFRAQKAVFRPVFAFCLTGLLAGCFTDPDPKPPGLSTQEVALDSLVFSSVTVDRVVELYQPVLDKSLPANGMGPLKQAFPRRVREDGSGRIVEYQWSQRAFGSWNAARERDFNLFMLRSYFLRPAGLFEDTAGLSTTAALYARARLHDPYTRYIDSAEAEDYRRRLLTTDEPKAIGIQTHVNDAGDSISLSLVAPGSPAWRAGLRRGMRVLAVNDSSVTGDSANVRFVRFFEQDSNTVKLTVRGSEGALTRQLVREPVSFPSVIADSLSGVGYIAVLSFTATTLGEDVSTFTEFREALEATKRFPVTILDLRGNGGGSFGVTRQMCEEVLSGGVTFKVVERRFEEGASVRYEVTYRTQPGEAHEGRRFLLLADSTSASASELFIAALRDRLDAPFRGTRTYGKGVGQASFTTPGNGYALMTYGRVLTASGVDYNGTGLQPTHPSSSKSDAMLAEAVAQAQGLSKGAAGVSSPDPAGKATLLDWNRRQLRRPGVRDLVIPLEMP